MDKILIDQLKINETDSITILIPGFKEKYNYFYKPGRSLHICDQIEIELRRDGGAIELAEDMFDNLYSNIEDALKKVLEYKLVLPEDVAIGGIGYIHNMDIETENSDFYDFSRFSLCNNPSSITFIYSRDNKIYLEISPLYRWLYKDPQPGDKYMPFHEYMKNYRPIALYEIDKQKVKEWLAQCERVLQNVDRSTQYRN